MEDNNNSFDFDSVIKELQAINTSVNNGNQKIDELTQYFIVKEQKEKKEAEKTAKAEAKAEEEAKQEAEEQSKADAEAQEQAEAEEQAQREAEEEQTETYTELLTDIRDQSVLTNQLLAIQGVFIGIVIGLLFMKSIFDRIFK